MIRYRPLLWPCDSAIEECILMRECEKWEEESEQKKASLDYRNGECDCECGGKIMGKFPR